MTALKNPAAHGSHWGSVVVDPIALVYLPGGHLVWAVHESSLRLLVDETALKNPAAHDSHRGWAVTEPTTVVYLPSGHVAWTVHWLSGQPVEQNKKSIRTYRPRY